MSRGFTLTEMLVVVAIIGVILAITLPVGMTAFEKARVNQAQSDLAKLDVAFEGYKAKYGFYPPASPASRIPTASLDPEFMDFPAKRVIGNVFYDPWGTPYRYAIPGTNNTASVDVASAGPDRAINDGNWMTSLAGDNADNLDNWSQRR